MIPNLTDSARSALECGENRRFGFLTTGLLSWGHPKRRSTPHSKALRALLLPVRFFAGKLAPYLLRAQRALECGAQRRFGFLAIPLLSHDSHDQPKRRSAPHSKALRARGRQASPTMFNCDGDTTMTTMHMTPTNEFTAALDSNDFAAPAGIAGPGTLPAGSSRRTVKLRHTLAMRRVAVAFLLALVVLEPNVVVANAATIPTVATANSATVRRSRSLIDRWARRLESAITDNILEPLGLAGSTRPERPLADPLGAEYEQNDARAAFAALTPAITSADFLPASPVARDGVLLLEAANVDPRAGITFDGMPVRVVSRDENRIVAIAPRGTDIDASRSHSVEITNPDGFRARVRTRTHIGDSPALGRWRASGVTTPSTWFTGIVRSALVASGFSSSSFPGILQTTSSPTDALITRKKPTFNGSRVEGTVRVFEGQGWTINGGTQVTADIYVVGTPTIRLNGNSSTGGSPIDEGGSATPSNYQITLNGNVQLPGRFHIRADAVPLPSDIPASIPNSPGTRDVTVNNPSDVNITNWNTVRDLTVNGSGRVIDVPPGNYRKFTLNGSDNRLNFTAGTYTFKDRITLNGGCTIRNTGAVTISTTFISMNGCRIELGPNTAPSDVRLNVVGNQHIQFNGNSDISALVRCSNSEVTMNGTSRIRGQLIANGITCNGGTLITGDAVPGPIDPTPPQVAISSPANNLQTTDATIVVTGTASDNLAVTRVSVNGTDAVLASGNWSIAGVPLAVGANTITATAYDAAGNQTSATINVTRIQIPVDQTPPDVVIVSPANGYSTEEATVTVSGTAVDPGAYASGVASVTVNGATATRDAIAGTWTGSVALNVGANTITVIAVDNAGNARTVSITVTRTEAPPVDSTKPVISITAPAANSTTFDASITVTGTADDLGANATGVRHVFVNGHEATYDAATKQWTATGIALASGENRIVAEAEDGATPPNTERAEITVTRRVVASPTLTITNPAAGSVQQSPVITVAGQATSGASDIPVTVTVNGQAATVAGGQYTKTVDLTTVIDPQTHTGTITVVATDSLGQVSQQAVTVVGDFGTNSAPSVAFTSAPTAMQPGGSYTFAVDATDNVGIASVVFATNGVPQSTTTTAPYTFTLTIPLDAQAGTVTVSAVATDLSGQTATAVVESGITGPGGVAGFAFDDATGFGLAGVTVVLGGGAGQTTVTGSEGAFTLDTNLASGVGRLSKAGYTPVERAFAVSTGSGVSLFDARLTPFDATVNSFSASGLLATGDSGRIRVSLGAGSFAAGTDVRVTSLSQQGLANLLPFGWSPVPGAIVDVRSAGDAASGYLATGDFPTPAELTFTSVPGLPANVPLVLARYDESSRRWTAVAVGLISGEASLAPAFLPGPGQYAFLVPDSGDTAPPAPAFGQPLPAGPGADPIALDGATATATTTPPRSPISVDAKGTVTVVANSTRKLPSGLWTEVTFDETYTLITGNPVTGLRASQDIIVYAFPDATAAAPNRLGARFTVKPSRTDLILGTSPALERAKVVVTIRSGRAADGGTLVGSTGGTVATDDGAALEIPAGALSGNTPVFVETVPADGVGLTLPAGYQILGAVDVDLSGATLSTPATLAVPAVAGGDARVVVAKLISAGGLRGPRVVARARETAGRLQSDGAPVVGVSLDGVRTGGRYVFIRIPAAYGWIVGTVSSPGSNPGDPVVAAGGVRVTVDKTPFLDVTADAGTPGAGLPGADPATFGRYVVIGLAGAGAAGQNAIEAVRLGGDATGGAAASLAAEQAVASADVLLASVPLGVAMVTPANASVDVSVASAVTVTFTKPVLASSVNAGTLRVTAGTAPVAGTIAVLAGGRVAVFSPAQVLSGSTAYTVAVTTGVRDVYGQALAAEVQSGFTTAAAIPVNRRLQPGQIKINYPDDDGYVTVTAPAGAIPEGSVVVVINNQTGASVTVVATSAALSVRILASVGDEIVLIIRQPDGVEYQTSQGAYRNEATGFTAVGRAGGVVVADDGVTALVIQKGSITGEARIRLESVAEGQNGETLPIPRGEDLDPANVPPAVGVRITTEGSFTSSKESHLELPAPENIPDGRTAMFVKAGKAVHDGNEVDVWDVVTSGRVEDRKIKTNSPPFAGLLLGVAIVVTVWALMPVHVRIVHGTVTAPDRDPQVDSNALYNPVPNVLAVVGQAESPGNKVSARTNAQGIYTTFDLSVTSPQAVTVTLTDDVTPRTPRYISAIGSTDWNERFAQGFTGFQVLRGDAQLAYAVPSQTPNPPIVSLTARAVHPEDDVSLQSLGAVSLGTELVLTATSNVPLDRISGQILVNGVLYNQVVWQPVATVPGQAPLSYTASITATGEGTHTVTCVGEVQPFHPSRAGRASYTFNALAVPTGNPNPLPGPPSVLTASVSPADGDANVDIATRVRIGFSEPVKNLNAGLTVVLSDAGSIDGNTPGSGVVTGILTSGATIIGPDSNPVSVVDFVPESALRTGHRYELVVTTDVVDTTGDHLDQSGEASAGLDGYASSFTTFSGSRLDEGQNEGSEGAFTVAVAGNYLCTLRIVNGATLLGVFDVSDPSSPKYVSQLFIPQRGLDLAMDASGCFEVPRPGGYTSLCSRYAVVTTYNAFVPTQAANLWVIDLGVPREPKIIGVSSLYFPAQLPTSPVSVRLEDQRAYVGNTPFRGVMQVDIQAAIKEYGEAAIGSGQEDFGGRYATTPEIGFGQSAVRQTVDYGDVVQRVGPASSVDVIQQTVRDLGPGRPSGLMPVVYSTDNARKLVVASGFAARFDAFNAKVDTTSPGGGPDGIDDRVLNVGPSGGPVPITGVAPNDAAPFVVRAITSQTVLDFDGSTRRLKDLAVVNGGSRLWFFDVTDPTAPRQYPSKSLAEILGATGAAPHAGALELEGTLAYLALDDRIAVIDYSDPANPVLVAMLSDVGLVEDIEVLDGFVYSTAAADANGAGGGLAVSIARPAAKIFVHPDDPTLGPYCSNPIIINRQSQLMQHAAKITFEMFGAGLTDGQATSVVIRKNGQVIDEVAATRDSGPGNGIRGSATWQTTTPIDQSANYTAEVVINSASDNPTHTNGERITFSYLIAGYAENLGLEICPGDAATNTSLTFNYLLGGNANVSISIAPLGIMQAAVPKAVGLHGDRLEHVQLSPGRYAFTIDASYNGAPSITDRAIGVINVTVMPSGQRIPGRAVVEGVDLATGSLGLSATDVVLPHIGLPIAFTRSYNSGARNRQTSLGYGWSHSYQSTLVHIEPDGGQREEQYLVYGADGGMVEFPGMAKGSSAPSKPPYHATLARNADGSFDYFTKSRTRYHFAGAVEQASSSFTAVFSMGNLAFVEDRNGNRVRMVYDGYGRLAEVRDDGDRTGEGNPAERVLKFTYEQSGYVIQGISAGSNPGSSESSCLPQDQLATYRNCFAEKTFLPTWRIVKIEGTAGIVVDYTYDLHGNLATVTREGTDAISVSTSDATWQYFYELSVQDPNVDYTHFVTSVVSPNVHQTRFEYDTATIGVPVSRVLRQEGVSTGFVYAPGQNAFASVVVRDGNGNPTTYTLAADGSPSRIDAPLGATTLLRFGVDGQKEQETDPLGTVTNYGYDGRGNLERTETTGSGDLPATIVTRASYDPKFSVPLTMVDGNGNLTSFVIAQETGNTMSVTLPTGRTIGYTYVANSGGAVSTVTDERGFVTTFSNYDAHGNPRRIERQTGNGTVVTTNEYDARSRLLSTSSTLGPTIVYTYDALDRVVSEQTTDPSGFRDGSVTTRAYYPAGQVQSETVSSNDGELHSTSYVLDGVDRVNAASEAVSHAGAFNYVFTYDLNSNLLSEQDRRGITTTYGYDALNHRTTTTVGSKLVSTAVPDLLGNPTSVTDLFGHEVRFAYDGVHRLIRRTDVAEGLVESYGYDGNGNATGFTDRNGRQTSTGYDAVNRPILRIDPLGRRTTWTYDDAARKVVETLLPQGLVRVSTMDGLNRPLTETMTVPSPAGVTATYSTRIAYSDVERSAVITDPRGKVTRRELSASGDVGRQIVDVGGKNLTTESRYHALGAVRQVTDPEGRNVSASIDGLGRPYNVRYPLGASESFDYDGLGNVLEHTDRRGIASSMRYDVLGRRFSTVVHDPTGDVAVETITFDDANHRETLTDANGRPTVTVYDGLHRVSAVTNAKGHSASYGYDGVGNVLTERNFRQFETAYRYDAINRPILVTDARGAATVISHSDSNGYVQTMTDRRGYAHVKAHDALGRLVQERIDGETVATHEYDGNGNRTAMVDGRGNRTVFGFDGANRLESIAHPGGQWTETFGYDNVGNVVLSNDGVAGAVVSTYDDLDHLETRRDGEGNTTTFDFDAEGLLRSRIDPKGAAYRTAYEYNGLRSLVKTTDARGGVWTYERDGVQSLRAVVDANQHRTEYDTDELHRVTAVRQPMGLVTTFGYDENSNLTYRADPKGQAMTRTFDALDRPETDTYTGATGAGPRFYRYTHDAEGNLTDVEERVASLGGSETTRLYRRSYDARGRVRSETDARSLEVAYGYDAADNLTSVRDASGRQVTYSYDPTNRLDKVTESGSSRQLADYGWKANGLLESVAYPNGMRREYGYDGANRLTTVANRIGADSETFTYVLDPNGNRSRETQTINGATARVVDYGYDELDRLTSAAYTKAGVTATAGYGYDAVGNRLTDTQVTTAGTTTRTFDYDAANRLTGITGGTGGAVTIASDANGNVTSWRQGAVESRFEYDARDQLRRVTNGAGAEIAAMDYDFARRRTDRVAAGISLYSVYGAEQVIEERGSGGQVVNRYDYGADLVRMDLGGEGERWAFADGQGSVTALGEVAGATVRAATRTEYDAWGTEMARTAPTGNAVGYTGQRLDAETGLMPLGNGERYYAPGIGRFLQQDSVAGDPSMPQSLNRFGYVKGNPLKYVDPSGNKDEFYNDYVEQAGDPKLPDWLNKAEYYRRYLTYQVADWTTWGWSSREGDLIQKYRAGKMSGVEAGLMTVANAGLAAADFSTLALNVVTFGTRAAAIDATLGVGLKFAHENYDITVGDRKEFSTGAEYMQHAGLILGAHAAGGIIQRAAAPLIGKLAGALKRVGSAEPAVAREGAEAINSKLTKLFDDYFPESAVAKGPKGASLASKVDDALPVGSQYPVRGFSNAADGEIALGINQHVQHQRIPLKRTGLLERFAGHVDARWYQQWDNYAAFDAYEISLKKLVDTNVSKANGIHFNLDGFNLKKFAKWANQNSSPIEIERQLRAGANVVTNYEFLSIIKNPAFRSKTIFYGGEGKIVPWDKVSDNLRRAGFAAE